MQDKQLTGAKQQRENIHSDDTDQRDIIHNQDFIQINDIKKALDHHVSDNKDLEAKNQVFRELMEPLIPVLQGIATKQVGDAEIARRIAKAIGIISGILLIVSGSLGIIWVVIQILFKFKE